MSHQERRARAMLEWLAQNGLGCLLNHGLILPITQTCRRTPVGFHRRNLLVDIFLCYLYFFLIAHYPPILLHILIDDVFSERDHVTRRFRMIVGLVITE